MAGVCWTYDQVYGKKECFEVPYEDRLFIRLKGIKTSQSIQLKSRARDIERGTRYEPVG